MSLKEYVDFYPPLPPRDPNHPVRVTEKTIDVCSGSDRLIQNNPRNLQISIKAIKAIQNVNDPQEWIANLKLTAKLDLEEFFNYSKYTKVFAQIRTP